MPLSLAYRLKTFLLSATIMVALCTAASTWVGGMPPIDPTTLSDTPPLGQGMSNLAQSEGCEGASAS